MLGQPSEYSRRTLSWVCVLYMPSMAGVDGPAPPRRFPSGTRACLVSCDRCGASCTASSTLWEGRAPRSHDEPTSRNMAASCGCRSRSRAGCAARLGRPRTAVLTCARCTISNARPTSGARKSTASSKRVFFVASFGIVNHLPSFSSAMCTGRMARISLPRVQPGYICSVSPDFMHIRELG